jgi:hypothetical protein
MYPSARTFVFQTIVALVSVTSVVETEPEVIVTDMATGRVTMSNAMKTAISFI